MSIYTVESLLKSDVTQTEAHLARGHERRVLRGVEALRAATSVESGWMIRKSSAVKFGVRRAT